MIPECVRVRINHQGRPSPNINIAKVRPPNPFISNLALLFPPFAEDVVEIVVEGSDGIEVRIVGAREDVVSCGTEVRTVGSRDDENGSQDAGGAVGMLLGGWTFMTKLCVNDRCKSGCDSGGNVIQ